MKKYRNPKSLEVSRRNFLKTTSLFAIGALTVTRSLASVLIEKGNIAIVILPDDEIANKVPPKWAVGKLKAALEVQGSKVRLLEAISECQPNEFCIFVSGMNSPIAMQINKQNNHVAPTEAESLCLVNGRIEGYPVSVLLAAGTDERGLVYALTELADRVAFLKSESAALEFAQPVVERPVSRIRSIMRQFTSELEDKKWFYDRDNWTSFLDMLVSSRVNRLSFTMGMGYNSVRNVADGYFVFPYPFFLNVPRYEVRARGLPDNERERNLEMLKFIGQETARRGLLFQLGIWTLAYKFVKSPNATYTIEGLTDDTHASYCRDSLSLLLNEIPEITGVTFRVHSESGIPQGHQGFWETQFSAIANCGRSVEIDMHAKNMEPETLEIALATGQPTVVSPKYCGEHMSLPYHQAAIREREMVPEDSIKDTGSGVMIGNRRFTRYGYADTLAENRTWDVVFRIWPGTQRFLLNGDPALFAGFGRHASFCGAAGIDLCGPLDFKGRMGSGLPGGRCAYQDETLKPRYDFEKYRYTYRLWGRLGYNPDCDPEIWRRVLKNEFGDAALDVENAIGKASRVLPLFTTAHGPSANCMVYWPEIYSNIPIANTDIRPFPEVSDPVVFGNVSPFDPQLFMSGIECGTALVQGMATGKYSPLEVAFWLNDIAIVARESLSAARHKLGSNVSKPVFRRVEEDVLIQSGMALFFAAKLRCSVLWCIYSLTGYKPAGEAAVKTYGEGIDEWKKMATRAKTVYEPNITYGRSSRLSGHWVDRIPEFDADLADLKKRLEAPKNLSSSVGTSAAEQAVNIALSKPQRPSISVEHIPGEWFQSGKPLSVVLSCKSTVPQHVTLHYRHVNQAERWQSVDMGHDGQNFKGEIPGDYTGKRYPLQYYFEVQTGTSEATMNPLLGDDLSNTPYYVLRRQEV